MKNNRIPLGYNTKLTKDITIMRLRSDQGGSSLTYDAKCADGHYIIIKEFYPKETEIALIRDGSRIIPDVSQHPDDEVEKIRKVRESIQDNIEKEYALAKELYISGNSNSVFSFYCSNITSKVNAPDNTNFHGTLASYLQIDTVQGMTLSNILKEMEKNHQELSLMQSLIITKKILVALKNMHEKGFLHLDIKDDNLYFPSQLFKANDFGNTYCILLDCGSAQNMNTICDSQEISMSSGYAPCEVQKAFLYAPNGQCPQPYYSYFFSLIGTHSDLYSVGVILYKLIMGSSFVSEEWQKINTLPCFESCQNKTVQYINKTISERLEKDFPYLVNRITTILCKALFLPASININNNIEAVKEDLQTHRYSKCDDFEKDIDAVIEILNCEGIHPEIMAQRSLERFTLLISSNPNIAAENKIDPVHNKNLFVKDWFAPAREKRQETFSRNQPNLQ